MTLGCPSDRAVVQQALPQVVHPVFIPVIMALETLPIGVRGAVGLGRVDCLSLDEGDFSPAQNLLPYCFCAKRKLAVCVRLMLLCARIMCVRVRGKVPGKSEVTRSYCVSSGYGCGGRGARIRMRPIGRSRSRSA